MPTWRNTDSEAAYFPFKGMVPAGGMVKADKFYSDVSDSFEVVDYGDSPVRKLYASTIGEGITRTGLAAYKQVRVLNTSGADILVVLNEDTDHAYRMVNGDSRIFDQSDDELQRDFDKMMITGEGNSGNVDVNAWK